MNQPKKHLPSHTPFSEGAIWTARIPARSRKGTRRVGRAQVEPSLACRGSGRSSLLESPAPNRGRSPRRGEPQQSARSMRSTKWARSACISKTSSTCGRVRRTAQLRPRHTFTPMRHRCTWWRTHGWDCTSRKCLACPEDYNNRVMPSKVGLFTPP